MGSQKVGMGKDLYDSNPKARAMFERANEILGFRLTDIMFYGPDEMLERTDFLVTVINVYAMVVTHCMEDFMPDVVIGYSSGESAAICCARVIEFETGVRQIYKFSQSLKAVSDSSKSGMSLVLGLPDNTVERICQEVGGVWISNYNYTGQIIISGYLESLKIASKLLREAGAARVLKLPFKGGFHSPVMQPALQAYINAWDESKLHQPICPVYSCVTATPSVDVNIIRERALLHHTHGVRFRDIIRHALDHGITEFEEIGAVKILTPFVDRIRKEWEEERHGSRK